MTWHVPEYWAIDIPHRRIVAHRRPENGVYADVQAFAENETLAPLSAPGNAVRIGGLLPPLPQMPPAS